MRWYRVNGSCCDFRALGYACRDGCPGPHPDPLGHKARAAVSGCTGTGEEFGWAGEVCCTIRDCAAALVTAGRSTLPMSHEGCTATTAVLEGVGRDG